MKPSKIDFNSAKLLTESYKWDFPESENNFKALMKEFPKIKKEQLKDIFISYDESYPDTHFFLKTHSFKDIKKFFEANVFKQEDQSKIEENQKEEHKKEDSSPLKKNDQTNKNSPKKEDSPNKDNDHTESKVIQNESHMKMQNFKDNTVTSFSKNFLFLLFDFFDPITLLKVGMTCKYLQEVANHIQLYKKFCMILFSNKNPLPNSTPFTVTQEYINLNPLEFDEITRNKANIDIRSLIWSSNNYQDDYKTPTSFYKQFENWRNCFLQVPRVCLKGFYVLKEKYIKVGEKDFHQTYDPIHIIEYFRYLRFFDNGLVIMLISTWKLPVDKLKRLFKKALTSNEEVVIENPLNLFMNQHKPKNELKQTILKGEYMRKEGRIFVKFCSNGSSVYEYELLIKSSLEGKNDKLIVEKKITRELTNNFIRDDNNQRASGVLMFEFKRVEDFALEIKDLRIKSVSL